MNNYSITLTIEVSAIDMLHALKEAQDRISGQLGECHVHITNIETGKEADIIV